MKKLLLLFVVVMFLAGCSDNEEESPEVESVETEATESDEGVEVEEAEVDVEETAAVVEEPVEETEVEIYNVLNDQMLQMSEAETVQGSGNQSHVFDVIVDGMVKFVSNNQGSSNFMIHVEDGVSGDRIGSAANHIGNYDGQQFVYLDEGEYILQVKSDGEWNINIEQPFLHEIIDGSEFTGYGSYTIGPITFDSSRIEILGEHDGDSNFMVHLLGVYGDRITNAFNEIGVYEGNHITTIEPDRVYYIDVVANGNWKINIQ